MYSRTKKLPTPVDFNFLYTPYAIQAELMKELYTVLEEKNIGIFESPTGTGKSLTLTCAALRWLIDHEQQLRCELREKLAVKEADLHCMEVENSKAVDWISAQYKTNEQRSQLKELRDLHALIEEYDQGLRNIKERQAFKKEVKRQTFRSHKKCDNKDIKETHSSLETSIEKELKDVLDEDTSSKGDDMENEAFYRDVQIFFCSRTHSQLAQVVREIKSTAYGKQIRCITLGSRHQLCVNPKIKQLTSKALINESCLELSKKGARLTKLTENDGEMKINEEKKNKLVCGCPFKAPGIVRQVAETALFEILDIEELAAEGNDQKGCPYYAARNAASAAAQLIMLPYQTLLHHRTRKRSGINLKDSVIIIDEAHNLLDTISDLYSCDLSLQHLQHSKDIIQAYKSRYTKLLSTQNLLSINQLLYIIRRLMKLLEVKSVLNKSTSKKNINTQRILRTYELSAEGEFFNIDLFQLLHFCERTRFVQKLHGFAKVRIDSTQNEQFKENTSPVENGCSTVQLLQQLQKKELDQNANGTSKNVKNSMPILAQNIYQFNESKSKNDTFSSAMPIYNLIAFLESLTDDAEDGRILINIDKIPSKSVFKYMVLNPSNYFKDIVQEARSIIIAGGTMQPTNELTEQLFRHCPERVREYFYDHVVPANAVLPIIVQKGPTGKDLCFNFTRRDGCEMLLELSMILQNLCQVVPAGLVCFFSSYDYLDKVYEHLSATDVLSRICSKKQLFKETRASLGGQTVEELLKDYAETIKQKGGAILLSVVGGKLSEGLNFKDDLCRGVVVVGMPYAHSQSLELQERMRYLDSTLGTGTGNQYYENLCMKAVNQCIGRAVRHINDYAAVYLLDERYSNEAIRKKLPQWIARNLQLTQSFGLVQAKTAKYFKQKRNND